MGSEGSHQVGGGEEAVLVSIHDTESLLELLDGRVGEGLEDIGFLRHLVLCNWPLCNTKSRVTIIILLLIILSITQVTLLSLSCLAEHWLIVAWAPGYES